MTERTKRFLIIPPVLVAIALFVWLVRGSREPVRKPVAEVARKLRVIEAPVVSVTPRAIGYGTSQPTKVWRVVAEVGGQIVEVNPNLKSGSFLVKDDPVLTIDPQEYQLVVTQLEAEIAELEASLAELTARKVNDGRSLEIEKASLELAQSDLERMRNLAGNDAVAGTELRGEERTFLAQQQKVQSLENSLNLYPSKLASLESTLNVRRAKLEQARIDLNRTKIIAPFGCRIGDVSIEVGQYVQRGEALFTADGIAATEIEVQTPISQARNLIRSDTDEALGAVPDMEMIRRLVHIDAVVRVTGGDFVAEWDARFDRIRERLDPVTRTVALVVVVDKPYERAIPGKRPPLFRDVFCEVELRGKPIPDRVIIPRSAVRGGKVYIVNNQNRLVARELQVAFEQANMVVVAGGVVASERVIVSDPTPAIDGMLIDPMMDEAALTELLAEANGQTALP
ncbi:MAG TPA: efflux transporter periplasmic adaptor subunit [Phycisphaerae bacterium]|nr:efflux transporter periplasmic adaptor subunit [Phycisphaerae bacterium]